MSNESLQVMAFRQGLLVDLGTPCTVPDKAFAATMQAELMRLGFMLDAAAFERLGKLAREEALHYYNEVLPVAKELVGAKRSYRPFYVNFPDQVMEMSTFELYLNALQHYWSAGAWEPEQELAERGIAFENTEFRAIKLVSEDGFKQLFTKLVSVNAALTPGDRSLVEWFVKYYDVANLSLPDKIPFKETLCLLASYGVEVPVKTPTDVLRIARFISGGDISLPNMPKLRHKKFQHEAKKALVQVNTGRSFGKTNFATQELNKHAALLEEREKFKFAHVRRSSRRYLLGLLEKTNLDLSEMQQRLEQWLRLGEILHPNEYRRQFPGAAYAFKRLASQAMTPTDERRQRRLAKYPDLHLDRYPRVRSYFGRVDLAFRANDLEQALALLEKRPGELARRLDWFMRTYEKSEDLERVFESLQRVLPYVSSKVLLELHGHLNERMKPKKRLVSLKRGSKMRQLAELPALKEETVRRAQTTILDALKNLLTKQPPLGKVWIDDRLKNVLLPASMRSANEGLVTFTRGTKVPFRAEATVVRPFVHWYDKHGRIDLDLSVGFLDDQFNQVSWVSYTNLRHSNYAVHSGDIRHRRGSCAEYVDIDIAKARAAGVRYGAVQVYNYNAGALASVDECKFGLMEQERPQSNEIFEPRTVSNAISLKNDSASVLICAIDLEEKSYLWLDVEMARSGAYIENTMTQAAAIIETSLDASRLTVFDLLMLHATSRGELVEDQDQAEVKFTWEELATDYAKVAQYMTV